MIIVNLKDGKARQYDLSKPSEQESWNDDSSKIEFQQNITAIGILFNSQWYALPLPKKFRQINFEAMLVESKNKYGKFTGEKIKCYADDILISIQVYWGTKPKMSRVDIVRIGKRRFNPSLKGD